MDMKYVHRGKEWEMVKKAIDAVNNGDWETANKVYQQIPISPETALTIKEMWGAQFLVESGYNLSWAEDKYGKDWLKE